MTAVAFQTALARLVLDRAFRKNLISEPLDSHRSILPPGLSALEIRRLRSVARQNGLDITRKMHVSFRLSRLQAGAPHVFELLARTGNSAEFDLFLERRKPTSFYFAAEAAALLRHLRRRTRSFTQPIPYLAEVIGYDHALLELDAVRTAGLDLRMRVRTQYDVLRIVAALELGRVPPRLRRRPRTLIVELRAGTVSLSWQKARAGEK